MKWINLQYFMYWRSRACKGLLPSVPFSLCYSVLFPSQSLRTCQKFFCCQDPSFLLPHSPSPMGTRRDRMYTSRLDLTEPRASSQARATLVPPYS